jgi:lipopolysaccharide transport system permease protein
MQAVARLSRYVAAIWSRRFFWLSLTRNDLRARYRRSILGVGWSLLHPLAMSTVLCIAFQGVFKVDIQEYGPYLLTGLAFWNFITAVTLEGCNCFVAGEAYIRQHRSPMAIYPLRTLLGATFHFLTTMAVVVVLAGLFLGFHNPLALLTLQPTLLLLFLLGWSMATLAAFLAVFFPDMSHLLAVGLQVLFYATPVIYPPQVVRESVLSSVMWLNPFAYFLNLLRGPLIYGTMPSSVDFAVACVLVAGALGLALMVVARFERRLIFYL